MINNRTINFVTWKILLGIGGGKNVEKTSCSNLLIIVNFTSTLINANEQLRICLASVLKEQRFYFLNIGFIVIQTFSPLQRESRQISIYRHNNDCLSSRWKGTLTIWHLPIGSNTYLLGFAPKGEFFWNANEAFEATLKFPIPHKIFHKFSKFFDFLTNCSILLENVNFVTLSTTNRGNEISISRPE